MMPVATGCVRLATLEWANEVAKAARGVICVASIGNVCGNHPYRPPLFEPHALDRERSTPLNSVLSSWPQGSGRPMVVDHCRGAGVSARRTLPGRARMYRLPGRRCQGCGLPVATKARAAAPVHLPECRSPSPWYVA